MSTHGVISNDAPGSASVTNVNMKLEVVVIPVSNVDRAKEFYSRLGWRLDADRAAGDNFRLIQFTPPGSGSSIQFGVNLTSPTSSLRVSSLSRRVSTRARCFTVQAGLAAGFQASTSASAGHTRRVSAMGPLFHSRTRTATAGCSRKSRNGFLDAFRATHHPQALLLMNV